MDKPYVSYVDRLKDRAEELNRELACINHAIALLQEHHQLAEVIEGLRKADRILGGGTAATYNIWRTT